MLLGCWGCWSAGLLGCLDCWGTWLLGCWALVLIWYNQTVVILLRHHNTAMDTAEENKTPAVEPAVPGFVGRCLIHWATGPQAEACLGCGAFASDTNMPKTHNRTTSSGCLQDTVSERLRRWTRNPLGSARRGSNPLGVDASNHLVWPNCGHSPQTPKQC